MQKMNQHFRDNIIFVAVAVIAFWSDPAIAQNQSREYDPINFTQKLNFERGSLSPRSEDAIYLSHSETCRLVRKEFGWKESQCDEVENIVFEFDQNLYRMLNQADLCITRAGASSLAEIASLNIPFITIPLPTSKDNHQFQNAKYYENKNCCWIIDQTNFDQLKFEDLLLDILKNGDDFIKKKNNLENLNYQNTWNSVNQNLLKIINEN